MATVARSLEPLWFGWTHRDRWWESLFNNLGLGDNTGTFISVGSRFAGLGIGERYTPDTTINVALPNSYAGSPMEGVLSLVDYTSSRIPSIQRDLASLVAAGDLTPTELATALEIQNSVGRSTASLIAEAPESLRTRLGLTDAEIRRDHPDSLL